MTYSQAVDYLKNLQPIGIQMGLERMKQASDALQHPEASYPAVHITGTNGKGSTARMIAAALTANGYKVGLYTSPMITELTDMILIDGKPIDKVLFADCINEAASLGVGLSEYECLTTALFLCFSKEKIDIAVIECCLGGETDATNIIPAPLCAVFTPVALDHTAILGNSIEEIAACKCGIIKPSCDVICAPTMHPDALGVIFNKACATGSTVYLPTIQEQARIQRNGTSFNFHGNAVSLRMIGLHQQENALVALETVNCLQQQGYRLDITKTLSALQNTTMPCRQEILSDDPFILLDGAHNPHGIDALCKTLQLLSIKNAVLVIGMLADKDVSTCLNTVSPYFRSIICCTPPHVTRALSADELGRIARHTHPEVIVIDDPVEAFLHAKKISESIVVGGSFYTASAIRQHILFN